MINVYKIIQQKIIAAIEKAINNGGTVPWKKPWIGGIPKNFISKEPYRGINLLLLSGGSYLTFKQIQDLQKKDKNIKLKKGSKSEIIVFWKFIEDRENEENNYGFLKYYNVFHISNVDGLKDDDVEKFNHSKIEEAEIIINEYKNYCPIKIKSSSEAYYSLTNDEIVCPTINQFKNKEEYYSTIFHEMIHSTGYKTRLNRFTDNDSSIFGSKSYSKEELVAEIGSNMILAKLNINNEAQQNNSISYLYNWLNQIKKDTKLIVQASQQAQKASDYIFNIIIKNNESSD